MEQQDTSSSQFDSTATDSTFKREDGQRYDRNGNIINLTKNRYQKIEMYRSEFGNPEDLSREDDLPDHLKKNYTK